MICFSCHQRFLGVCFVQSSSLESKNDNIFFLVQDPPVMRTSSLIDIDLGTLPPIHGESKIPHQFGESNQLESSPNVFLLHLCQHLLLFQFLKHKLVRIHLINL